MEIEVFLTANQVSSDDVKDKTVVVIDVLRAASTIVTALQNGARAVVPVPDMAHAGKIAANLDAASYRMGGERDGIKIEGYHLGNSPLEYTPDVVKGLTIILNTTNGTGALAHATEANALVTACFLNISRVVQFLQNENPESVAIICAGWRNRISLEDTLCAGMILYQLWEGREPGLVSDAAHIAFTQYRNDRKNLEAALRRCNHAQRLQQLGFEADVNYCIQMDTLPLLPYYRENRLVVYKG